METIIGFAAGYLLGAREGQAGFDRLKASAKAIAKSPEARRMAAEAMTLGGMIVRRTSARGIGASARGIGASASGVAGLIACRVSESAFAGKQD